MITHILENLTVYLIYQSNQDDSPSPTITVIIRSFTSNLILKAFTRHVKPARLGTIKIQMLTLLDNPLMNLTRIEPL